MLKHSAFYAGFAVDDLAKAKAFYADTVGIRVIDIGPGLAILSATNGYSVLFYEKPNHEPAQHTILNFPVDDIETAVAELIAKGVTFEQYPSGPIKTVERMMPLLFLPYSTLSPHAP